MNGLNLWQGPEELLELFSVDAAAPGGVSFCELVWLGALAARYPAGGVSFEDVARGLMRQHKLSPVVYWGRIKRTLAPLLAAERADLAALGLQVERWTGRGIAEAAASALARQEGYIRTHSEDDLHALLVGLGRG